MVRSLADLSADALGTANSCEPDNPRKIANDCGNAVSKIMAAFSGLIDDISDLTINCPYFYRVADATYKCAFHVEQIANLADRFSTEIGRAILSCGLLS